jgi:tetratricopeptide (TPR) repeat protein
MAKDDKTPAAVEKPTFSDADQARARQCFRKAADCRERRAYEYAIECFLTGLAYWPEAVEEGHMPLRSLAIQRQQVGGKKPGLMDGLKKSMTGKDAKQALFNAEHLLSLDPANAGYADGVLRNAIKLGYLDTAKWVAPLVYDTLKKDKKPNKSRFKSFRDAVAEAADLADARGESALGTWLLEQAVNSLEYLIVRCPGDEDLRNEQRDLAGRLTISRGKYEQAGDFRDSLQDADKQKRLHDTDRLQQGEQALAGLIAAARAEWTSAPTLAPRINAFVDALLKTEQPAHEDEAIRVLTTAHEQSRNYNFKLRADDVRLRQLGRAARALAAKARDTRSDDDRQQARLAALEQRQAALAVYRERVAMYPTDLRLKFKLGSALFEAGEYDEAIPILQAARTDPRSRHRAAFLIGRAFLEKQNPAQAIAVLREAIEHYELTDDFSKDLLYWLGRAYEAAGNAEEAKGTYGKLLREDYNYRDGDARKRLEALK